MRMQEDPRGTLSELYSEVVDLFTLENIKRAWKVVKGVGNIAIFVVAVSCPACAVGVFAWSLAKSVIDAIFMYADEEATGAILGKLSFDVVTSGYLAGFGFDHNIVLSTLKENVWLGMDTLCTSLKLSQDVQKTAQGVTGTKGGKAQFKDEDIVLSKESLDLVDEAGQFVSQIKSNVVNKLTCKMIKLEAAKVKGGDGGLGAKSEEDECAPEEDPQMTGQVSCGDGMTVRLGAKYPINGKVMGITTTDWKGLCERCGQCLEQKGVVSSGWYCEQDMWGVLGIWLKQAAPADWEPQQVATELQMCKPLTHV